MQSGGFWTEEDMLKKKKKIDKGTHSQSFPIILINEIPTFI